MKQRKMYIDVDGVLVVWDRQFNCVELSRGFGRLMRFCKIHNIQPFWITMWSKNKEQLLGLGRLLWPDICPTMAQIQIIEFDGAQKAHAIDYASDFVWIEDGLSPADAECLRGRNALDRFFCVDGLDPECLLKFMEFTRERMNLPEIEEWGPQWDSFFSRPRQMPALVVRPS